MASVFWTSQKQLILELRAEGFNVSIRTLRYWRSIGLLPNLYRNGTEYHYPLDIKNKVKQLCIKYNRVFTDVIGIYSIEEECFKVYKYVATRLFNDNKIQVIMYTDRGILVERKDTLDGIF